VDRANFSGAQRDNARFEHVDFSRAFTDGV